MKIKILVLTCMHNRAPVSDVFLHGIARLKSSQEWADIDTMACVTETDEASIQLCKDWGINYVLAPNSPVSGKWNKALNASGLLEWDYILIMGDDDLMNPELLSIYRPYIDKNYPFIGVQSLFFTEAETGKSTFFKYPNTGTNATRTVGAGRMISRKAIDRVGFSLWPLNQNSSLDMASDIRLAEHGIYPTVVPTHRGMILDIKSGINLWPIGHFDNLDGSIPCDFVDATWWLLPSERQMIKDLPEKIKMGKAEIL